MTGKSCWIFILIGYFASPGLIQSTSDKYLMLNDYLEKNVESEDLTTNLAKAQEWLISVRPEAISSLAGDLKYLTKLQAIDGPDCNMLGFEILEQVEEKLWNGAKPTRLNYPLRRLDRMLEQYAFKQLDSCGLHFMAEYNNLNYSLKRNMYNKIDMLLEGLTVVEDVEANIVRAKELLHAILVNQGEGALTDALKQFVGLKSVASRRGCDEQSYSVAMRNEIAIPYERGELTRGIDKLIEHYLVDIAETCLPVYPKKFTTVIQQLDMLCLRSLRVIASESLLVNSDANETTQLQFQYEFTTPELVAIYQNQNQASEGDATKIKQLWTFGPEMISRVIKALALGKEKSVEKFETETLEVDDGSNLIVLYDKYLRRPCQKYLAVVGRTFVQFAYYRNVLYRHMSPSYLEEFTSSNAQDGGASLFICKGLKKICDRIVSLESSDLEELSQTTSTTRANH